MAIHVLADSQMDLCRAFSASAHAFDQADWRESESGVPLLEGCLARFECEQHAYHDAGDHVIVVGKVLKASMADGDALTFYAGKLGQFAQH